MLFDRQVRSRAGESFLGSSLLGAAAAARTMALSRVIALANQLPLIEQPKSLPAGPQTEPPSMIFVVAALALVSIAFGGNFLAIRVVVHALPPFTLQAIRFLLAGVVLYLFASSRPRYNQPTLRQWRSAAIGGGLLVGAQGAVSWSEQYLGAGMGALVISTIPLWVTIIGAVFLHRRVLPPTLLGIVCGFVGLLPIVLPHVTGSSDLAAFGVLLFAAISWSIGTAFGAQLRVHDDALLATSMQLLSGSILLLLAALVNREPSRIVWSSITPSTLWGMAYLIVFGSIAGYTAYVWLLKNAPPHIAAAFAYIAPIVTLFFGYVLHEETVTAATMAGALVILIGVGLVVGTRSSAPAQPSGQAVSEKSLPAGAQRAARQTHEARPQPIGLGRKICTDSKWEAAERFHQRRTLASLMVLFVGATSRTP